MNPRNTTARLANQEGEQPSACGERIADRRVGHYSSEDVHQALFEEPPEPRSLEELKEGAKQFVKMRQARR